jgi:hypothetical protein
VECWSFYRTRETAESLAKGGDVSLGSYQERASGKGELLCLSRMCGPPIELDIGGEKGRSCCRKLESRAVANVIRTSLHPEYCQILTSYLRLFGGTLSLVQGQSVDGQSATPITAGGEGDEGQTS